MKIIFKGQTRDILQYIVPSKHDEITNAVGKMAVNDVKFITINTSTVVIRVEAEK